VVSFTNGVAQVQISQAITLPASASYLRVTRAAELWSFAYSSNGTNWTSAGSFDLPITLNSMGVYAANHNPGTKPAPAHTAVIDYFFNSAAPIAPEDGRQNTIGVTVNGEGEVNLSPDKDTYACGEQVQVQAVPADEWQFASWGGALTGTGATKTLTVTGDHQIIANFFQGEGFIVNLPAVLR
jgi:hypothetical protein